MKPAACIWLLLIFACVSRTGVAEEVAPAAQRVAAAIDSMDVEHHWPAGVHVDWQTGVPDGKRGTPGGKHTHCSAFVAAAAQRLGIYILRPPEHSQLLLANAQYDWLAREGAGHGWQPLDGAADAQDRANLGYLVVAAYKNHHEDKPGHIAIVRPSAKSAASCRSPRLPRGADTPWYPFTSAIPSCCCSFTTTASAPAEPFACCNRITIKPFRLNYLREIPSSAVRPPRRSGCDLRVNSK